MKLNSVTVSASSEDGLKTNTYRWSDGDDLGQLEACISNLQDYLARRKDPLPTALASQPPIEINPS